MKLDELWRGTWRQLFESNAAGGVWGLALGGRENRADGAYSAAVGGRQAWARLRGQRAHAAGMIARAGDAQYSRLVASAQLNAASGTLLLGGTDAIVMPPYTAWTVTGSVAALRQDAGNVSGSWTFSAALRRAAAAGATVLLAHSVTLLWRDSSFFDLTLAADTTLGGLRLSAAQRADNVVNWCAVLHICEVGITTT